MAGAKEFVGKRVRELRKSRKMSQEQLAERIGSDPRHVSRIELGQNFPMPEMLDKLAAALDVELPELFDFRQYEEKDVSEEEFLNMLKTLEVDKKLRALRIMREVVRALKA